MLWPADCKSIEDIPEDLTRAIEHAFKVLGWFENLQKDETPPEWMWPFDDQLNEWFDQVERDRNDKYGGGNDRDELSSQGGIVLENEYAADMRRARR